MTAGFLVAAVCNISVLTFLLVLNFLKDLNICESISVVILRLLTNTNTYHINLAS